MLGAAYIAVAGGRVSVGVFGATMVVAGVAGVHETISKWREPK